MTSIKPFLDIDGFLMSDLKSTRLDHCLLDLQQFPANEHMGFEIILFLLETACDQSDLSVQRQKIADYAVDKHV